MKNDSANGSDQDLEIECDFCPLTFNRWSLFYVHRCTHTGQIPIFTCSVCTIEFSSVDGQLNLYCVVRLLLNFYIASAALKNHKLTEHNGGNIQEPDHSTKLNFQCRHCPEKSRTLKERGVHERTHLAAETSNPTPVISNDSTAQLVK